MALPPRADAWDIFQAQQISQLAATQAGHDARIHVLEQIYMAPNPNARAGNANQVNDNLRSKNSYID